MSRQQYLRFISEWKQLPPRQKILARKYISKSSYQPWDRATPFTTPSHYEPYGSPIKLHVPTVPNVRVRAKRH